MAGTSTKPGNPGTTLGSALKALSDKTKGWWAGANPLHNGASSPGLIAYYWLKAGGSVQHVNEAVAAALAESGGSAGETSPPNSNGTRDVGLWQINSSHGPALASTDPSVNAKAAVQLSHNGSDWSAWCSSYDDGDCHGSKASPHYKGAGLGNRQSGAPVLPLGVKQYLYAKDAIAGAVYGAESAGGIAVPLTAIASPVDQVGADAVDSTQSGVDKALNSATGGAWGTGTVGEILGYIGYGMLAALGAALMLLALAILTLALVERQAAVAALPGVGRVAGAASEVRAGVSARGARNQGRGAQQVRGSSAGRALHGERGRPRLTRESKPTAGGDQRRARRVHDVENNRRPRHGWQLGDSSRHVTREQAGSPF